MRHRSLRVVALWLMLAGGMALADDDSRQPSRLRAGAAAVDVTPTQFPLNMPGGFRANIATSAHDPLHARAIVLANDDATLAMVVVDSLGAAPEVLEEAKANASQTTGIPAEHMLICSTHTHSGPPSNAKDGPPPAVAYREKLVQGIAESIQAAHAALQPASVAAESEPLPDEVANRRWYLKPGRMPLNPFGKLDQVKMNPGSSPDVLDRPAGPIDPELSILSLRDQRRKPLALLANYSLHYVGAIPKGQLSADYFGEFSRLMPIRMRSSGKFVAMMSNGTSGDINNLPFLTSRPPREPFEQVRIVARKAADTAWRAERKIESYQPNPRLAMAEREVTLTYRRPSEEEVAEAKAVLAVKDKQRIENLPRLAQNYARQTVRAAEREESTVTVKLQAIRIGDLAICGIPFETFAEIGLELKRRSPFDRTFVIGLANGRYGYLPTPQQHRLGGYETWLGTNKVQKDASVILVDHLLEMLDELKREVTPAIKADVAEEDDENTDSQPRRTFLIGNSLTWDTVPPRLDGDVQWHVDCGKSLPYIVENPDDPCVKTSTLWPAALQEKQYDVISLQSHYGSTLPQDVAAISRLIQNQHSAVVVIHTGWARSAERVREWQTTDVDTETRMCHSKAYFDRLLAALRESHPEREFLRTRAMDMLQIVEEDIATGNSPFEQVTDLYRDKIHMNIVTGRYLMHNAMRHALGQPRSSAGFEKLQPSMHKYLDTVLDRALAD